MRKEEMFKGLESLEFLLKDMIQLGKDAMRFIFEKGMWEEFMKFHSEKQLERNSVKQK